MTRYLSFPINPSLIMASLIIASLIYSAVGCQPRKVDPTLIGQLVVDTSCGHYVIVLVQGSTDASHLAPEWRDTTTGILYVNVFGVSNPCGFGANILSTGDRFSFEFDPHPPIENCPLCHFAYPAPPVSNAVKNVHKIQ